jgi:hypothetical protein
VSCSPGQWQLLILSMILTSSSPCWLNLSNHNAHMKAISFWSQHFMIIKQFKKLGHTKCRWSIEAHHIRWVTTSECSASCMGVHCTDIIIESSSDFMVIWHHSLIDAWISLSLLNILKWLPHPLKWQYRFNLCLMLSNRTPFGSILYDVLVLF